MSADSWKDLRMHWGGKLHDLTPEARNDFIRDTIRVADGWITACLLDALRFRFDAPDLVFDFLDELRSMDNAGDSPPAAYEAWGRRARAALAKYIGDEPDAQPRPN